MPAFPPDPDPPGAPDGPTRVWLVERTYSDDEQNIIVLIYATLDGRFDHRKERAVTDPRSMPTTRAAVTVDPDDLGRVADEDRQTWYAEAASRMAADHDPDDGV
ncbi:MAG: hypothetical protein V5A33_02115 [Halobacteriales archaeon]